MAGMPGPAAARTTRAGLHRVSLLALSVPLALMLACGDPEPPNGSGDARPPGAPSAADTTAQEGVEETPEGSQPTQGAEPVRVWLSQGESVVAVPRPALEPSLRAALESLVAGPTAEERGRGLSSWFGEETRGVIRAVEVDAGLAVVDFQPSLPTLIPGAGSSAGSGMLLSALDSTVFQFPSVDSVEYRLGGSCPAFWEWLQRECAMVRR